MDNKHVEKKFGNKVRIRVCGICISQGRLLLVKHKGLGPEGQLWIPPGGGMHFGESAEECLKREVAEETGLEVKAGRFLFIHEYVQPPLHAVELFFIAELQGGELKTGTDPELSDKEQIITDVAFLSAEEISGIEMDLRHEMLKRYGEPEELTGLRGYFRFQ